MRQPTVFVASTAVDAMTAEAHRCHPVETGGMLIGWDDFEAGHLVVATIIGPGPNAEHHTWGFTPDGAWQQEQLDRIYVATGGRLTFVGDWHVHPAGGFGMSRRDRRTMAATADEPESRLEVALMGLLAKDGERYRLGMWTLGDRGWPLGPPTALPLPTATWTPTPGEAFWGPLDVA